MKQKTATKEALLTTAMELFRQRGFQNVTLDDICKAINVTKTAFYYYYKSKDELIRDYFSADNMLSNHELASILCADDYARQVLQIMEVRIQQVTHEGVDLTKELYRVYLADEVVPLLPEQSGLDEVLVSLIKRAQQAGQMKNLSEPGMLKDTLCYLSNGIVLKWIMMGGSFDILEENRIQYEAVFLM